MLKPAILTALFAWAAFAGDPVNPIYQTDKGVAVKGTDVVAYFTLGAPTPGVPAFTHEWSGAKWQFANAKHLEMFKASPAKYAPQYGGYCSYAVSIGKTASVSPKAWKIVDGKLYLNHSLAQGKWRKDIPGAIAKADQNWPKIEKKPLK